MKLEFNLNMGPEYMSADEIAVHAILNGYHLPKINFSKIEDKLIADAYAGKLGPLEDSEVEFAMQLITELVSNKASKKVDK